LKDLATAIAAHQGKVLKGHRVRNAGQLVQLVDALGFAFAFTLRTGDAPIPACFDHLSTNDTDRKWSWMWGWKDELPLAKKLYYGVLLARKPTFVSMKLLPTFYATFGRAGESDDHVADVRAGRLSDVARRIIEYLAQNGETQTKRMRAELGITSKEGRAAYGKAALVIRTVELAGGVTEKQLVRLFDWDDAVAGRAIARAERERKLVRLNASLVLPKLIA
jgi:hypothetical protein